MSLKPLEEKDLPLVLAWRNAPEVRRNMYSNHEISQEEHLAWFVRLQHDSQSRWFIHIDTVGRPDGVVYFTQYQPDRGSSFWGFYAGSSAQSGVGLRMEFEALEKAFGEFGLHKLNCEVLISNGQVINLHNKFGFTQEGVFRDYHFDGDKYVDVVRFGILDTEWAAKREEVKARITKLDSLAVSTSTNNTSA